jgi:hypothetical protein
MSSNLVMYTLFSKSQTLIKMNCPITDLSLILISFLSKFTERVVESRLTDFLTEHNISTQFSLPILNSILQILLFLLFMIISSEPVASNKFLAPVFLIFPLHLIPLIIPFFLNASHLGLVSQVLLLIGSNLTLVSVFLCPG